MSRIKVLIVDKDIFYRDMFNTILKDVIDINVVGMAPNGVIAYEKILLYNPDVVIAGCFLSDMNVKEFTKKALELRHDIGILVASLPQDFLSAKIAIKSIEEGAFDIIEKTDKKNDQIEIETLSRRLKSKIRCFSIEHYSQKAKGAFSQKQDTNDKVIEKNVSIKEAGRINSYVTTSDNDIEAVLIGVSTGGPKALNVLIPSFPIPFRIPVIIVLHMPEQFTGIMANELNEKSVLSVKEARDGEECRKNNVYLAPGGVHLTLERKPGKRMLFKTVDTPPENGCKPSVDVLFRSAANAYKAKTIAVIMTGMGKDGTKGIKELKKYNSHVIAQDKLSSVVWGMPGSVVDAGYADEILPLEKISDRIIQITAL